LELIGEAVVVNAELLQDGGVKIVQLLGICFLSELLGICFLSEGVESIMRGGDSRGLTYGDGG